MCKFYSFLRLIIAMIALTDIVFARSGMDSELSMSELIDLADVEVVSATKKSQKTSEAPSIISVITEKQIKFFNYQSVAEALQSIPGTYVSYDYVFYDVGVRGITGEIRGGSRLVKVLIDMQPVSFRSETINLLGPELIPMEAIKAIEVIRGPGSALYGANAFLGVINIVTKEGKDINGTQVGISAESFNSNLGYGISALSGYQLGSTDFIFGFSHKREDRSGLGLNCTTYPDEGDPCVEQWNDRNREAFQRESFDDLARPVSLIGKSSTDLGDFGEINFLANFQGLDSRANFSDWGLLNHQKDQPGTGNRIALNNWFITTTYVKDFNEKFQIDLGLRLAEGKPTRAESLQDHFAGDEENRWDRSEYGNSSQDAFAELRMFAHNMLSVDWIDDLTLLFGYDHASDSISFNNSIGVNNKLEFVDDTLTNTGIYSQLLFSTWNQRLGFVYGIRHDEHVGADVSQRSLSDKVRGDLCSGRVCYNSTNTRLGFTLSVYRDSPDSPNLLSFVDELYLKALQGTSFKAPASNLLYNEGFLGQLPFNPNAGLKAQDIASTEFLFGFTLLDKRINGTISFFQNTLENKAEFNLISLNNIKAVNGATVESQGVEVETRYQDNNFSTFLNFSSQESNRIVANNSDRITDTYGFPNIKLNVGGSYLFSDWNSILAGNFRYIGERTGFPLNRGRDYSEKNLYKLPSYGIFDLNFTAHDLLRISENKSHLTLSVKNLLDTKYNFPGYQPYYQIDIPGMRRRIILSTHHQF
jgi:iron complex outermembrane receptor protein